MNRRDARYGQALLVVFITLLGLGPPPGAHLAAAADVPGTGALPIPGVK
jgi:hypothetical protein